MEIEMDTVSEAKKAVEVELQGEKNEKKETKGQLGLVGLMMACGFFYFEWLTGSEGGLGVLLFTVLLCGSAGWYMEKNGFHQDKESLFYLGITGLSALNFVLLDNEYLKGFNILFLSCAAVYWICVTTKRRIDGRLSYYLTGDFANQLILMPFGSFSTPFWAISTGGWQKKQEQSAEMQDKKAKKRSNLLFAVLGLIIAAPALLMVTSLLSSADAAFEALIDSLHFSISLPDDWLGYGLQLIMGVPVACYLFGLLYANVSHRSSQRITKDLFDKAEESVRVVPQAAFCAVVGAFILIYIIFFATQAAYLFSAFQDSLPVTMTYAEYARRGFFELCTVAGINLAVICAASLFTVPSKGLRTEKGLLCVMTMLLIATAVSKMGLYIHYYGLTQLRFYTTCFMIMLFLAFVFIGLRQIKSFNCAKCLAAIAVVGFLSLCYCNADGLIASYNIDRHKDGTLGSLDTDAFYSLSDGAFSPIYQLYMETEDEDLKERLLGVLIVDEYGDIRVEQDYRSWNYQRWQAENIRDLLRVSPF